MDGWIGWQKQNKKERSDDNKATPLSLSLWRNIIFLLRIIFCYVSINFSQVKSGEVKWSQLLFYLPRLLLLLCKFVTLFSCKENMMIISWRWWWCWRWWCGLVWLECRECYEEGDWNEWVLATWRNKLSPFLLLPQCVWQKLKTRTCFHNYNIGKETKRMRERERIFFLLT